jgi:hypothetical protein
MVMMRTLVVAASLVVAPVQIALPAPAAAQPQAQNPGQCADTSAKKQRRSMFGSVLGSIGGSVLGRVGAPSEVWSLAMPATSYLGEQLMKMLDCKEQQQAAKATDQAVRGGVGTEVAWKSESRPNVSGTSKVMAAEQTADGGQCLTVNDVVIVDGEETTVPKKMCRAKGASAYARV